MDVHFFIVEYSKTFGGQKQVTPLKYVFCELVHDYKTTKQHCLLPCFLTTIMDNSEFEEILSESTFFLKFNQARIPLCWNFNQTRTKTYDKIVGLFLMM